MEEINPYKTPADVWPTAQTARQFRQFWSVVLYLALLTPIVILYMASIASAVADEPLGPRFGPLAGVIASTIVIVAGIAAYVAAVAYVIRTTYWLPAPEELQSSDVEDEVIA